MSPEVKYGHEVDERADIYGFGVLLWELAHLHAPAEGARLRKPCRANAPALDHLMQQCLSRRPADRPSAHKLVQSLQNILEAVP